MFRRLLSRVFLNKDEMLIVAIGTAIMAFGIVNVHIPSQITEGGILGLVLFFYRVLGWNPSTTGLVLDMTCYLIGFSLLGKSFIKRAAHASVFFALFYRFFLWMGPVLPDLYHLPVIAAIVGGIFIGIGCGLCVSQGSAAGGDDALAMVISRLGKFSISRAYLLTDGIVLLLSLAYINPGRLIFSFITTIVSSLIIGQFEIHFPSFSLSAETV